jgi:hypothetical protein
MKIKNIILENSESDNELFGRPTWTGHQARQELKNIDNAYVHATRQEFVNHVRDLAKNQFGVKTRVSAVAKKAGARTATFWFGSGEYIAGKPDKVVHEIKAELERQGFVCKFTDSGWLSVRVPDDYERNSVAEDESDEELFGRDKGKKPLFTDEGLPKLDPGTQRRLMDSTNHWLGILPELSEWQELVDEAGEDTAEKIIADFVKFRDYVRQNNIVAAIGSIQRNAQNYDWDESFQLYIENDTGIDIWDLMDIEDKNQSDAFAFYAGRRRLKENDESDDELFGYRVRVDGRAIDMQSIDLGDIMQSDYKTPNFVGAYVDSATFRDGTQLSNKELDQLKDVLVDQGMWETMIMNQIAEVGLYESDMSDEDLFGTEASRKFAVVSPDGEILKELENVTVQQAIEMARAAFVKWGDYYDDYGGIALIRSNIEGEYDENSQEIPFSKEIDESDMSDDELFAYRDPKAVRVDGRAVDMRSIDIDDIIQSDYPDFVDAYVDAATFRDGTPLSDQEREELEKVLRSAGMWETMIMDQIAEVYESDKSDDDLFGASDDYTDYQGLRQSSLISAYRNLYDILYGDEDHYWGLDDHEVELNRRRNERQLHKLLIHARSEYGEDFYQQLVDAPRKYRDRLLLPAFDRNILSDRERLGHFNKRITKAGKLHGQDANMLKKDLKQWQGKHPKPDHLPESGSDMSDDEMFGNSSTLSRAAATRIRKDDPEFSSLAVKINQLVRKLQNSSFDWDDLRRGSTLYNVLVNNDRALDEIIWELPNHVLERIIDELENLCDRYVKESELAESEVDDMGIYRKRPQLESLINEYINMLTEAELAEPDEPERKSKTQTKQKPKLNPDMFAPKADQPLAKTDPLDDLKNKAGIGKDKPKVDIKKASQADTLKVTGKIEPTDDMRDMLSRMRDIDIDPDLAGYPEPEPPETLPSVEVNTKNLPAVAGQALQAAGVQNPDFHQVANLPGNMADQIRQLGKNLFGALTVTPTKRIHVVANLGGQGPNTNQEVQAVAGFLKEHGEDLGPGDIDFDNVMPGYSAQTHMFNAAGIRWMLVKDFAGAYIYCWPEEDSLDASPKLSNNTDTKQLR